MNSRIAEVQRNTTETQIRVRINLDGSGVAQLAATRGVESAEVPTALVALTATQ